MSFVTCTNKKDILTGLQFVLQSESNASDTAELSPMGSMTGDCVTTVLTGGSIEKIQASYSEDNKSVTAIKYYKTDGAKTFGELARQLGIDPERFEATMSRFNDHAARGEDPDFGRTEAGLMAPGRVRALDSPPYYAVEIHPGALGTNGGPRIDTHGRVRAASGGVVPGLYAAGNTAANTFGWAYPSGGGTIGNAVVFGYLAGRHAANRNAVPSPNAD